MDDMSGDVFGDEGKRQSVNGRNGLYKVQCFGEGRKFNRACE